MSLTLSKKVIGKKGGKGGRTSCAKRSGEEKTERAGSIQKDQVLEGNVGMVATSWRGAGMKERVGWSDSHGRWLNASSEIRGFKKGVSAPAEKERQAAAWN